MKVYLRKDRQHEAQDVTTLHATLKDLTRNME